MAKIIINITKRIYESFEAEITDEELEELRDVSVDCSALEDRLYDLAVEGSLKKVESYDAGYDYYDTTFHDVERQSQLLDSF